jgi:hypothetical protein
VPAAQDNGTNLDHDERTGLHNAPFPDNDPKLDDDAATSDYLSGVSPDGDDAASDRAASDHQPDDRPPSEATSDYSEGGVPVADDACEFYCVLILQCGRGMPVVERLQGAFQDELLPLSTARVVAGVSSASGDLSHGNVGLWHGGEIGAGARVARFAASAG